MATILLTGMAGFIGAHTAAALKKRGDTVIGIDNFNDYYDPRLKRDRVRQLVGEAKLYEIDLADRGAVARVFSENRIDKVCHLAAQAGVRYSLQNPYAYESANNAGTLNLLEQCKEKDVRSFIYASSSSVYGANTKVPFAVDDRVDDPVSLYAATKRYNELLARVYHHLYGIHVTGLRFFTVYGPWGRPDMGVFAFLRNIFDRRDIEVFNHGKMKRDFTFYSDIVQGVVASLDKNYPQEIFNLGNSQSVELLRFIGCLEKAAGIEVKKKYLPMQPGDVVETYADIEKSRRMLGFDPKVSVEEGTREFAKWYRDYYGK